MQGTDGPQGTGGTKQAMTVRRYVAAVAFLGILAVVQSAPTIHLTAIDPLMLAILLALAALTQRLPVFLFRSSAISVSFAAVIAAYVLYGTGVGVFCALVQAAVNAVTPRPKPALKVAFNSGSFATSAWVAGEVFRLLSPARGDVAVTCLAVALSAFAYFVVNTGLTAGVIALSERQGFFKVWRTNYAWMPVNFLATAAQGAALALASQSLGTVGVVIFTLPLGVAWYSFRLYMSKSREVRMRNAELESANDALRRTNDRLEESLRTTLAITVAQRLGRPADEVIEIFQEAVTALRVLEH